MKPDLTYEPLPPDHCPMGEVNTVQPVVLDRKGANKKTPVDENKEEKHVPTCPEQGCGYPVAGAVHDMGFCIYCGTECVIETRRRANPKKAIGG